MEIMTGESERAGWSDKARLWRALTDSKMLIVTFIEILGVRLVVRGGGVCFGVEGAPGWRANRQQSSAHVGIFVRIWIGGQ